MKKLGATILMLASLLALSSTAHADQSLRFKAAMSGAQEVPEVVTDSTGEVRIQFDQALSQADFQVSVRRGVDIVVAHFHCGRPGENGPVVAFLFGPVAGGVDVNGELAKGTLTNADFVAANCVATIGRPVNNIASLAFAMAEGLIYANAHSVAHPGGVVRGQMLED